MPFKSVQEPGEWNTKDSIIRYDGSARVGCEPHLLGVDGFGEGYFIS